jgi:uncharacterized membrane protein
MLYLILKLLHIIAVIAFLGNITTGLFWKFHADRASDPKIIAHAFEGIIRSDRWFTIPGVVVIVLAGVGAAIIGRFPILGTGWILWSIVLFSISGIAFSSKVAPLQIRILNLARAGMETNQMDWDLYRALSRAWEFWGLAALLTPVVAVILMVLKPSLPAL